MAIKKGCENDKKQIKCIETFPEYSEKNGNKRLCQKLTDKNSITIYVWEGHIKTREPRQQNEEEEVHTILNCISIIVKEEVEERF